MKTRNFSAQYLIPDMHPEQISIGFDEGYPEVATLCIEQDKF